MNLDESRKEVSDFYWETDISTEEIQTYYNLPKSVYHFVIPIESGTDCPNCGKRLVYKSRSARTRNEEVCVNCNHKHTSIYSCRCSLCTNLREKENQKRSKEREYREAQKLQELIEETSTEEYIRWAITKLSRRDKIFLQTMLQVLNSSDKPSWQEVCDKAKVVSHKKYLNTLLKLKLVHQHPEWVAANPGLHLDMIQVKNVRNVSKSLRFDVLQRDKHTCQYCGRKSPDVELEIDHLLPVAEGGTDDFWNLVTSCFDCNRGKSAKIIKTEFGDFEKEDWKKLIQQKRFEELEKRREGLEEVILFWAKCRGQEKVSDYDLEAIYTFIEKYDPLWIKNAIQITSKKRPSNYVKYVAGILRQWGEHGFASEKSNHRLDKRMATAKQQDYIKGLLDRLDLELGEVYFKKEYNELTMLDAQNLIEELAANKKP